MAADWIKMRTDLFRDPKVCLMADCLMKNDGALARHVSQNCQRDMTVTRNVMRNVTVGALVTVWGVMRHRGKRIDDDLAFHGATIFIVDDVADLPGLGQAMACVGWLVETKAGIVFPKFFAEYNTEPGVDAKQKNAERQQRYREKRNALRNVTVDVTVAPQNNAREREREREREENKELPPTPKGESFNIPSLEEIKQHCTERGSKVDPVAFHAFYESKGWRVGNQKMRSWKSAVITWERNEKGESNGSGKFNASKTMPVGPGQRYRPPDGE